MRNFLLSLCTLFCFCATLQSHSQTASSSGDWNVGSNWVGGVAPVAGGNVIIPSGRIIEINSDVACARLEIQAGGTLRVKTGAGARTLTVASTGTTAGTNGGDIIINGTLDLLGSGADSVTTIWNSTHNSTKTLGGSGSIEFASLRMNHSTSTAAASASILGSSYTLTRPTSVQGNVTIANYFVLERGIILWGSQQDATQNHTIGHVRVGSASTNTTLGTSCFIGSVTLTNNTVFIVNNAVRCSVTVNVQNDVIVPTTIPSGIHTAAIGMTGPDARGATTVNEASGGLPAQNQTRLIIAGSLSMQGRSALAGNGVYNSAGSTQMMDSLVIDIGKDFHWRSSPTYTACSQTRTAGFAGYTGGFGHSGRSYPVFKFRGGTPVSPALIDVEPLFFIPSSSGVVDPTCHWRIEEGAYVRIKSNSVIGIREGRRLTVNGILDVEDGGQIVACQVGTSCAPNCSEPSYAFGVNGRIIVRDSDVGLGPGNQLYTDNPKGVLTRSSANILHTGSGISSGGRIEYPGPASNPVTARGYGHLYFTGAGVNYTPTVGTVTIPNNGSLNISPGATFQMDPTGVVAYTIGTSNTTLNLPPGAVLETNGESIANFARFGNGTTSGSRTVNSNTTGTLSGRLILNGSGAETLPVGGYDTVIVDKSAGTVSLVATDTTVIKSVLQLQAGDVAIGAVASILQLNKQINGLGGSPTGRLVGGSTGHLIINHDGAEPASNLPSIFNNQIANLTVNTVNDLNLANPLTVTTVLNLTNGVFATGNNLTFSAGTINRAAGSLTGTPTFGGLYTVNYLSGFTSTTGPELSNLAARLNNVTIQAGADITAGGDFTVANLLTVNATGIFRQGANSINFTATAGNPITLSNATTSEYYGGPTSHLNFSGSSTTAVTLPLIRGGVGNLTINRPLTLGTASSLYVAGDLTFTSIRTITIGANRFTLDGNLTGTGSFTPAATSSFHLSGTGTLSNIVVFASGTIGGFHINRNGYTFPQSLAMVIDTLDFGTGTTYSSTGTIATTVNRVFNFQGNITSEAGNTLTFADSPSGQPQIEWPSAASAYAGILVLNRASGMNVTAPLTLGARLDLTNGTLTHGGNLTIPTGALINRTFGSLASAPTFNGLYSVTYLAGFNGSTGHELSTSAARINNITVNATADVTCTNNYEIANLLTVAATGIFRQGANTLTFTATAGNPITLSNATTSEYYGGATSNIVFSANSATATTLPLIRGGVNNLSTGRPITLGGSLNIAGDVTFTAVRSISIGANRLTLNGDILGSAGTFTPAATSSIYLNGSGAYTTAFAFAGTSATIGGFRILRTGGYTFTQGNTLVIDTLEVVSGSTINMSGRATTVNRAFLYSGGLTSNATSSLTFAETSPPQAQVVWPTTLSSFAGTLVLNRANGMLVTAPLSILNPQLRNGELTHGGNLTVLSTGRITKLFGSLDAAPTWAGSPLLTYGIGAGGGTINTGPELPATGAAITVNNTGNTVILNTATTATSVTLTAGKLQLAADLTLPATAAVAGTATNYIVATTNYLIYTGITNTPARVFGVGSSSTFSPVRYNQTAAGNGAVNVRVRVRDEVCNRNITNCTQSVPDVVAKTWDIDILSGTPNATLDLGWLTAAQTGTFNPANPLAIYRFNSSVERWQPTNVTNTFTASVTPANRIAGTDVTIRITNKTQFSPHAVAEQNAPLPVSLLSFTAKRGEQGAILTWSTSTELNNRGWKVQRSYDNKDFTDLGFVEGNGTSTQLREYSFTDIGALGHAYYRLRQEDFDGTSEYSPVVYLAGEDLKDITFSIFPNPTTGIAKLAYIGTLDNRQQVTVQLLDASGKLIEAQTGNLAEAATLVENASPRLVPGVYMIRIMNQSETKTLKLVKQ